MKNTINFWCFSLLMLLMLGVPSCKEDDKCESQYCLNGGSCNPETGKCVCPQGFTGEHCEIKVANPGYVCQSGTCVQVTDNAQYTSLSACQSACGPPPPQGGYNCVNGNCQSVTSGAQYTSLSACQSACSIPPASGFNCTNGTCVQASGNYQYPDLASCQNNCAQQTGKVTFWKSCNFTEVSVTINGQTKQISQGFETEPLCDASGTATFVLPVGTYTFVEVPQKLDLSNRQVTVTPGSCTKINVQNNSLPYAYPPGQPCQGEISFWSHGVSGCNTISVTINGITKQISKFYPNNIPPNDNGFAVFNNLPPGKYTYSASCGNHTWVGDVELPRPSTNYFTDWVELIQPGYGKVTFYISYGILCDPNICPGDPYPDYKVQLNGITKSIYGPHAPNHCMAPGESGTYFLPAGTYQYQRTRCCGGWETGSVTIYAGECILINLN